MFSINELHCICGKNWQQKEIDKTVDNEYEINTSGMSYYLTACTKDMIDE